MLQCANQYMTVEVLVAGKREDHKRPCVEKSRGQPLKTIRRCPDRPEPPYPRPPLPPLKSTQIEIFL
ncbi:hypothetical protein BHE74_00031147 [Ensete ventricosum]|nr:hypothetical protein BHE74_00031147 [Ensete ventricosum]